MWMAYVQEVPIVDLKSGIEHLYQKFDNLYFDAHHESVYQRTGLYSSEECEVIAEQYSKGADCCQKFLNEEISQSCFVEMIKQLNLEHFLHPIKEFLDEDVLKALK